MARREEKEKAVSLRKKGLSYSQIRKKLGINKSTLSGWLRDMPLPKERLDELQRNDSVIEKIRQSKKRTRDQRLAAVHDRISKHIGKLSKRELFIAGLFLYWAEGGKTTPYSISLSNTDPSMIRFYLSWLSNLKVPTEKIIVRLHLYADMDVNAAIKYWKEQTEIPFENFRKPYIKRSKLSELTYTGRGHGTCNVIVNGRDIAEYVRQGLKYISNRYS